MIAGIGPLTLTGRSRPMVRAAPPERAHHRDVLAFDAALVGQLRAAGWRAGRLRSAAGGRSRGRPWWSGAALDVAHRHPCTSSPLRALVGDAFGVELARHFGAAQHHAAAAEQPGRDRAVKRFGRGGIGHAGGDHARHQPVFGKRAQHRVEPAPGASLGMVPVTSSQK
jgi:hypothetical protein